jgi:hypothetical protein
MTNILHKDISTIRLYCRQGKVKAEKFGRDWVIYIEDINKLKFIDRRLKQYRGERDVKAIKKQA